MTSIFLSRKKSEKKGAEMMKSLIQIIEIMMLCFFLVLVAFIPNTVIAIIVAIGISAIFLATRTRSSH